jgi:hypothetical protein
VAGESAIYERFKPWLLRYRGGAPAGFLAAIIAHESGGNPGASGDPSLGEFGLFQLEAGFPPKVGLPADARLDPETNVFLGALEYNLRAVEMMPYAPLGSSDSWRLARLGFAIGSGGTKRVIDAATGGSPQSYRGRLFDRIRSWANQTGAIAVSSGQPASKVLARINAVQDQWDVGQRISPSYGPPERIPAPKGLTYRIPASVAPYLSSPLAGKLLALGALGALGVILYLARKDSHGSPPEPAALA